MPTSTYSDTDLKYCICPVIISKKSFKTAVLCVVLTLYVTTEQRAGEGAVHPADGEAGGPEEEPPTSRRNSIPGSGAAPSDGPHHCLHPNHASLRRENHNFPSVTVNEATCWLVNFQKDWTFYTVIYWMIFLGSLLSVDVCLWLGLLALTV